jgi:hypothetical protein
MYIATFNLRQDTALIHFLHDQPDATLRATDLKPKLDKWIKKHPPAVPEGWVSRIAENGHCSLDYKVSIRPVGARHNVALEVKEKYDRESGKNKLETTSFPHLLGNMGGKEHREDLKNLVLYEGAEITVKTWHRELLDRIKTELPSLLANENFGNRSGKGFGSFACISVDGDARNTRPDLPYCFDWQVEGNTPFQQQKDLFSAISWFYKCLRSGINQVNKDGKTEFYFKSLMFAYAQQQGQKWDKYSIKNHFFEHGKMPDNPLDYRDWLGLSTEEMWGRKYFNKKITKSAVSDDIDRFPSPILFKPVKIRGNQYKVWFGVRKDLPLDPFKNAAIEVKEGAKKPLILHVPPNFNFDDFFRFAFVETDIDAHVDDFDRDGLNPSRHWIYKDYIQPIFNSIQNNQQRPA